MTNSPKKDSNSLKSLEELVNELNDCISKDNVDLVRLPPKILARCSVDLCEAIDRHSKESNNLGNRVWWLNFVIAFATVVGVAVQIIKFFC